MTWSFSYRIMTSPLPSHIVHIFEVLLLITVPSGEGDYLAIILRIAMV